MSAPKSLKSFYGARAEHEPERVQARKNTAKSMISPGERPQEIFTPPEILEPLRTAWGGIALDPCGHPDAVVGADETWYGHQVQVGKRLRWAGPGTEQPWRDRTFVNPNYDDLPPWFDHALAQYGRWCMLIPVRPHREWWRVLATSVDAICWLNPVKFVGYSSGFPAPLCLAYRGSDAGVVVDYTRHLGDWTRAPMRC